MGRAYDFLAKWTRIDELLAPYNAGIFEKIATGHGPRLMTVAAAAGVIMLCAGIAMTGGIAVSELQRVYLAARGVETQATVVDIVRDPPTWRGPSELATLRYTFETRSGEKVSDEIRRAPWEFAGLGRGSRMELLYAEQWPQINLPRPGFRNSGLLAFMFFLGLAFCVHIILFLIRYRAWLKRPA